MKTVLIDSGLLVALGIASDPRHASARSFVRAYSGKMPVPAPVVTESCFFLTTANKVRMLEWLTMPGREVFEVPVNAYHDIGSILTDYASVDPDFTDAAIVWLAGETGCCEILTTDQRDFGIYRIRRRKRFRLVKWHGLKV